MTEALIELISRQRRQSEKDIIGEEIKRVFNYNESPPLNMLWKDSFTYVIVKWDEFIDYDEATKFWVIARKLDLDVSFWAEDAMIKVYFSWERS